MICIQEFSIGQVKVSDLEFESSFSVTMQQDKECHVSLCSMQFTYRSWETFVVENIFYCTQFQGMIGYFDVGFDGVQHPVHLSTSPQDLPTHWKQTIFFFKQPLSVHTGSYSN